MGLDTQRPILKIDDLVFEGKYEAVMGTNLFFSNANGTCLSLTF